MPKLVQGSMELRRPNSTIKKRYRSESVQSGFRLSVRLVFRDYQQTKEHVDGSDIHAIPPTVPSEPCRPRRHPSLRNEILNRAATYP